MKYTAVWHIRSMGDGIYTMSAQWLPYPMCFTESQLVAMVKYAKE